MVTRFHCLATPCPDNSDTPDCRGHRATKRLAEIADVLAWADGWDGLADLDEAMQTGMLQQAIDYQRVAEGAR